MIYEEFGKATAYGNALSKLVPVGPELYGLCASGEFHGGWEQCGIGYLLVVRESVVKCG
jgi:hypothetical protein